MVVDFIGQGVLIIVRHRIVSPSLPYPRTARLSHAGRMPASPLKESFAGPPQKRLRMSAAAGRKSADSGAPLWTAFFVAYLGSHENISVAGPTMMKALDVSPQTFGYVLASFTAGYALMQIPGGMFADRFGAKRILIVALLVWSLFTGLTGLAASIGILIAVRFFFGVGEGMEHGAQFKAIGDTFGSQERSAASGVFLTSLALGPAFVAPIAAAIIGVSNWQTLFLWFTIPGVLVRAADLLRFFPPTTGTPADATAHEEPSGSFGALIARPLAWMPFAAYMLFNVAFWGLLNWMPSYLERRAPYRAESRSACIATIPCLCGFCGLLVLGYLGRGALYRYRPFLVGGELSARRSRTLSCIYGRQRRDQRDGTLVRRVLPATAPSVAFWAVALEVVPANLRGTFSGFINFGGQIGGFFSPIVVGSIVQNTKSYSGGFGLHDRRTHPRRRGDGRGSAASARLPQTAAAT